MGGSYQADLFQPCGQCLMIDHFKKDRRMQRLVVGRVVQAALPAVARRLPHARCLSSQENLVTPKDEYSGKATVTTPEPADRPFAEVPKVPHNQVPGTDDTPWTPKGHMGKTPMVKIIFCDGSVRVSEGDTA